MLLKGHRKAIILLVVAFAILSLPQPAPSQETKKEMAIQLNQEVAKLYSQGRYKEALPIAKRAVMVNEQVFGKDHPLFATSLSNLGTLLIELKDYSRAEPLFKKSVEILEKAYGPNYPEVAIRLTNIAYICQLLGKYKAAKESLIKALEIKKKVFGNDSLQVAKALSNLGALHRYFKNYTEAERFYREAFALKEKLLGPKHIEVAKSLNDLAEIYDSMGDYPRAVELHEKAAQIRRRTFGQGNPDMVPYYKQLASLYLELGQYDKAQYLLIKSLTIRVKAFGDESTEVAEINNDLAILYLRLGDYERSKSLFMRAMSIFENVLGPDHPYVARTMNNLGTLYSTLGEYGKAKDFLEKSLEIRRKSLGPDHFEVASSLNILASVYADLRDYSKALSLYKEAINIREKAYGPGHPVLATDFNDLGVLYIYLKEYTKAEAMLKRSIEIRKKTLGHDHPDVAGSLYNLAMLYAALGDYGKSYELLQNCLQIDAKLIDHVMGFNSEDQKIKFISTMRLHLYVYLSLVVDIFSDAPTVEKDALDAWIARKGIILEAQKRFQEALIYSDDPEAIKTFQELSSVRSRISHLIFSGPGKEDLNLFEKKIGELEKHKNALEAKLSRLSQGYAMKQKMERADSATLAKILPTATALLEFARIKIFDFKSNRWHPPHYLVFLLYGGRADNIRMLDLGEAQEIDRVIADFKKNIERIKDRKSNGTFPASRKIHDLVFAPIKRELGDVKEIFISPDGNLNLIPFEVLQGPDGRYLIEEYTFNYLAAGRDILGFGQIKEKGGKALLMGDPDFELGEEGRDAELRTLALKKEKEPVKRSSDMSGFHFNRLPGTREEVKAIHALLGKDLSEIYTGKEALEELLNRKRVPSILHLATHGFFLEDMELAAPGGSDLSRGMQLASPVSRPKGKRIKVENPLLRSGFVLAGANRALASGDSDRSDGIVTAEKILGLRLRGTDMVVLSACETGVGEIKTGEGVFGLRRAFTQAGAKSMVMSMWSVPDQETKELMIAFYRNILSGNMNRCQALRRAALQQMQIVRERYGSANPFYWGAFVFMGEPW